MFQWKIGTAVSYLKRVLLLLQNYKVLLTKTMGILNDVILLADYGKFTEYMKIIYFATKQDKIPGAYMGDMYTSEAEYCTLYRVVK